MDQPKWVFGNAAYTDIECSRSAEMGIYVLRHIPTQSAVDPPSWIVGIAACTDTECSASAKVGIWYGDIYRHRL